MRRHLGWAIGVGALFLTLAPKAPAQDLAPRANTFAAFGPKTYMRAKGAPTIVTDTFTVSDPTLHYSLRVTNSRTVKGEEQRVSRASITLNGIEVIEPRQFGESISVVQVAVPLQTSNQIAVTVTGPSAGVITVEVIGGMVGSSTPFGPAEYQGQADDAHAVSEAFSVSDPTAHYLLRVTNNEIPGGESNEEEKDQNDDEGSRFSRAAIAINGLDVVRPEQFGHLVSTLEEPIFLKTTNQIEIKVHGKPDAKVTVEIVGPVVGLFDAFAPKAYAGGSGAAQNEVDSFSVLDPTAPYLLMVSNSAAGHGSEDEHRDAHDEEKGASKAIITLNGVRLVDTDEFADHASLQEIPVVLAASNQIGVRVEGGPGWTVSVAILGLDTSTPTITATAAPPPNAAGWNDTDVTVSFACSDATSGIAVCPPSQTLTTEGAGQMVQGTVVDRAGNTARASLQLNIDKTPPAISAVLSPLANAAGWNNTNVTVSFVCQDAVSGVAFCPPPVQVTTPGAGQMVTGTATDLAGNSAIAKVPLNIEKTPPSITASATPPPNAAGWNNSDVTVSFYCGTSISGGIQCPGPEVVSTEGANQRIAGSVSDLAGNSATASVVVSLDKTPPTLTIISPANGTAVTTSTISVSGSVAALSGIATATCNGVAATLQGGLFSCPVTLNAGANTITASATDLAGNSTSTSISVTLGNVTGPPAPADLAASANIGQVVLTWTASPGANGYKVKRSTDSGGPYTIVGITPANSLVDTEVLGGTAYYYVVRAVNAAGESPNSNEASETALDTGPGVTIQDATGGTVNVADPQNPNAVVSIVIPPGVLGTASDTIFVAFSDTPPGPLNATATAAGAHFVSRVITLSRTSGLEFIKPIHVTVPYDLSQVGSDDALTAVYWDTTASAYDVLDTVAMDRVKGTLTFQTVHFSQFGLADINLSHVPPALDTGFRAFTDGFSAANFATMTGAANKGACFGLTAFAKWFYETEVPVRQPRLAFNETFDEGSPAQDDVARELIYWGFDHTQQANEDLAWLDLQTAGDASTAADLIKALVLTNHPQLVVLALNGSYRDPTDLHSVLVYSYSPDTTNRELHFGFYDPNFPLTEQQLVYLPDLGQFLIPPYTDPYKHNWSWVYFSPSSDFFWPVDFLLPFDDASNGWPDPKRHFNEIAIDQGKSTGLTLLSTDGPDPVANPAVYAVIPGTTTFQMNWSPSCPCFTPDGSLRTKAYAHIFFDKGKWSTDVQVDVPLLPWSSTPFSFPLPAGTTATEMIVIISDSQHKNDDVLPASYLLSGYEGFLRIKLKPPLYQITQFQVQAGAKASDLPGTNFPHTIILDAIEEGCAPPSVLASGGWSGVTPFSANFPLACTGAIIHQAPPGFHPSQLISPPVFSGTYGTSLGAAAASASFQVQLDPNSITASGVWSWGTGDPTKYDAFATSDVGMGIQVNAPVHYKVSSVCSFGAPWRGCGGFFVNGQGVNNAEGVFTTFYNTIVLQFYSGYGPPAGSATLSITLTP